MIRKPDVSENVTMQKIVNIASLRRSFMHRKAKTSSNYVQFVGHLTIQKKKKKFSAQKYAKFFGIIGKLSCFYIHNDPLSEQI